MKPILRSTFFVLILFITAFTQSPTVSATFPYSSSVGTTYIAQGDPDVKVWVNTASGVYHCPGTRWYGNTKRGVYMTQKQAKSEGYRPAYGNPCS